MGGRRRIPIERIPGLQARRVCFAKRRKGLFRKCLELCELLPGYELAAVAFSPDVGNPFAFAAPSAAASPADLFRNFLNPLQALVPREGSDGSFPAAVSRDGTGGRTVEDDGLMEEEERAKLVAALGWADGLFEPGA